MVKALSLLGLSGGSVISGKPYEWDEQDMNVTPSDGEALPRALERFSELHSEHTVMRTEGYVTIIDGRSQCPLRLNTRVTFRASGPFTTVFSDLLHTANPANPGGPLGFIGGVGQAGPQIELARSPVVLDVQNVPLTKAFESLVRQVPGIVWFVSDETRDSPELPNVCRVGFYVQGRQFTTGWVLW